VHRLTRLADALDWFIDQLGRITSWTAFAIVAVMAYNVLLRYFFRTGSVAMQELEWHLMAPLALLGMSYSALHDGHVQVDILYGRLPPVAQRLVHFISCLMIVAVVAIILRLSIPYVQQSYNIGEGSPDPGGLSHRWILKAMIPAGFALMLVQSLAALLRAFVSLVTGQPIRRPGQDEHGVEHAA
jgi:TRAP-type mannitol/chloroaromatic compound transport system permease small subunit